MLSSALSTLAIIVAGNGDICRRIPRQSPKTVTLVDYSAVFGDNLSPNSALSPFSATVAEFGDYCRQCGQGFTRLHLK